LDPITLVLLPGLEGTGNLFAGFVGDLPQTLKVVTAAYPQQRFLTYSELIPWLTDLVPKDGPFALLAESYGTPLAVKFSAARPPNLVGVILSAGFISSPVRGWRLLAKLLARPLLFRFRPPDFLLEHFLLGLHATMSLKISFRQALQSTSAEILAKRARAVLNCDATHEIRRVNVPLLYLRATEDRLVGKISMEEIRRLHPESTSVAIRAPHLLLQREPRAAAAIAQFLKTECMD
jgi:pimeloyl-[acyl-carrier protein] methyl ester esterase